MRMRTKICYLGTMAGTSLLTIMVMKHKNDFMNVVRKLNQNIQMCKTQMMTKGKQATDEVNDLGDDVTSDVRDIAETLFREIEGLNTKELKVKTKKSLERIKSHVITLQTLIG